MDLSVHLSLAPAHSGPCVPSGLFSHRDLVANPPALSLLSTPSSLDLSDLFGNPRLRSETLLYSLLVPSYWLISTLLTNQMMENSFYTTWRQEMLDSATILTGTRSLGTVISI